MKNPGLRARLLAAGMSPDQADAALHHFQDTGGAPPITTQAEYDRATAIYRNLDAALPAADLYSPVARYVINLGTRLADWEVGMGSRTFQARPV